MGSQPSPNRILTALDGFNTSKPSARKWLIGPTRNWGREALLALARLNGGWIGWEPMTLRLVAQELAFVAMSAQGVETGDDIRLDALRDAALDEAVAGRRTRPEFARLAGGVGFRKAVRDAVAQLRVAGVPPGRLGALDPRARDVATVLEAYERRLHAANLADPARLFQMALDAFEDEAPFILPAVIVIAPSVRDGGLPGRLLGRLADLGAVRIAGEVPLDDDNPILPPHFANRPGDAASFFRAATPADEVREVLRRIVEEQLPFDQVELVTTDPDTYAVAFECVAAPLGIRPTSLDGLPFVRTRLGRALERWLRWLEDGLPADLLREAIEAGELVPPGDGVDPMHCARLLRELAVGWGLDRWTGKLAQLDGSSFSTDLARGEDESDESLALRRERRVRDCAGLSALLTRLLAIVPDVPERGSHETVRLSVRRLAEATRAYLSLVAELDASEALARNRVDARLGLLARLDDEPEPFAGAVATVRGMLAEQRAWVGFPAEGKPWASAGGALHLTNLAHAGITGRPHTFVLGLDADRVAGARHGDPILDDGLRAALGEPALPTTRERAVRKRWEIANALASLRGRITLSYASSADLQGREVGPAPQLLQAFRIARNEPQADYEALREHLGDPCCAITARRERLLDERDAWLAALADGHLLLNAEPAVRLAFPGLDLGLRAHEAAAAATPGPWHGVVPDAAGRLDPRMTGKAISPSSLERLAKCPLAWFYERGLELSPEEEPVFDPDRWLSAADRGKLLHTVFERFVEDHRSAQDAIRSAAAEQALGALVEAELAAWRGKVPPPSEVVYDAEATDIRAAARAFLAMERAALDKPGHGRWLEVEASFGFEGPPATFPLPGGTLLVRGRIDRVDETPSGLVIIDYKTGSPKRYKPDGDLGPFNGGRNLQPAIYVAAAAGLLGRKVAAFEYRFPTVKGEADTIRYEGKDVASAAEVVAQLLEHPASGRFLPTLEPDDCAYCDFQAMCRVSTSEYQRVEVTSSPRAEWASQHAASLPEYAGMMARLQPGGAE